MVACVFRAKILDAGAASAILPLMKQLPGFTSGEVIVTQDGKALAIARFDSEENAERMMGEWNTASPTSIELEHFDLGEIVQSV